MPDKFKNKYRIESTRLQNWDYGWQGAYFITICTKNRECFFGDIENGVMKLSGVGVIADIMWYEIKNHAKNMDLGEFVVMPNHIHGIIILHGNDGLNKTGLNDSVDGGVSADENGSNVDFVETRHALSLQNQQPPEPPKTIGQKRFQNQGKNTLSSIMGGYKSVVTKHAHRLQFDFDWQPRFYDHIIRDEKSFQNISAYIRNNPSKWRGDRFHK